MGKLFPVEARFRDDPCSCEKGQKFLLFLEKSASSSASNFPKGSFAVFSMKADNTKQCKKGRKLCAFKVMEKPRQAPGRLNRKKILLLHKLSFISNSFPLNVMVEEQVSQGGLKLREYLFNNTQFQCSR